VSRSAACACPAATVSAARVFYLFFSHILSESILFLSSKFFISFFPGLYLFLRGLPLSFLPRAACCLLEL
jgi:hypothetical protein